MQIFSYAICKGWGALEGLLGVIGRFGHNFWLEGPIDLRTMRLLQDLFRDTPLDHIWSGQLRIFGQTRPLPDFFSIPDPNPPHIEKALLGNPCVLHSRGRLLVSCSTTSLFLFSFFLISSSPPPPPSTHQPPQSFFPPPISFTRRLC